MEYIGYILAVLVGISLGLIGSGGSILTVPILVYVMGVMPATATAYSLFVVGSSALVGGVQRAINKQVAMKTVFIYGIPSLLAVYFTRRILVPAIPDVIFSNNGFVISKSMFLMSLFAVVMILAALSMIRSKKTGVAMEMDGVPFNYPMMITASILEGILTGLVGAGGGFLIIPALVLLARMPMKLAVGTSLFIIATKSLIGFTGDLQGNLHIDWSLLGAFTACSIIGIFLGMLMAKSISGERLKTGFGWFILAMGMYIIAREWFGL
jgi:uncharacterized membrane protein YfcA